jgi:hypothetical protein
MIKVGRAILDNGKGPRAEGTSFSFDGTAKETMEDGTPTNFGYTKGDLYQEFNGAIWVNTGQTKLSRSVTRNWTSDKAESVTWDSTHDQLSSVTVDNSYSRSYTVLDYTGSYDEQTGHPNAGTPPTSTGWSLSYDGNRSFTKTDLTQKYRSDSWGEFGKTILLETEAKSYSSDDSEGSVIAGDPWGTTDLGGGTFEAPLEQTDLSLNRSYLKTDYSKSYTVAGVPTAVAPEAKGWSWAYDGTAILKTLGYTKSDIYQKFDNAIWQKTGLARLELVSSRSYTSEVTNSDTWTYDNPYNNTADKSWSRSYTETNYKGSYDANGRIVTTRPPQVTDGYSLSFDGEHTYTRSEIKQTNNEAVWANLGKVVLKTTEVKSWRYLGR